MSSARARGVADSRVLDHVASSPFNQSRACSRSFTFAASSGGGSSLPLPRRGQGCCAGGVVPVLSLAVRYQRGVGRHRLGPELGGRHEVLLIEAHLAERQPLGVVARFLLTAKNRGKSPRYGEADAPPSRPIPPTGTASQDFGSPTRAPS